MRTRHHRGITIIEVLVVILLLVLVIAVLIPALPHHHGGSKTLKCATQVRNIAQAMTVFANSNRGTFPLPSKLDADNATLAADPAGPDAKNTESNILSIPYLQQHHHARNPRLTRRSQRHHQGPRHVSIRQPHRRGQPRQGPLGPLALGRFHQPQGSRPHFLRDDGPR